MDELYLSYPFGQKSNYCTLYFVHGAFIFKAHAVQQPWITWHHNLMKQQEPLTQEDSVTSQRT